MKDWKAELDTFFQLREQQKPQEQRPDHTPTVGGPTALEEFMVAVAVPAFEEFAAALKEHGCRIRLRLGDSSMRIVSEFGGVEEFDYTLWAGTNTLSAEARSAGRRVRTTTASIRIAPGAWWSSYARNQDGAGERCRLGRRGGSDSSTPTGATSRKLRKYASAQSTR